MLVTLDVGFADIRRHRPEDYPGLIVLRLNSQSRVQLLAVIEQLLPLLESEPVDGSLWIVTETGVRIHGKEE